MSSDRRGILIVHPSSGPGAGGAGPEVAEARAGVGGGLCSRAYDPRHEVAALSRFLERLGSGTPIVADGGMGALLASAVPGLRCPEEANLRAAESVVDVHLGYIRAGAELIETNTFGASRPKLAQHFLEDEFERINSDGVKLAREAREVSGRDVFIAGSIGPLGDVDLRGDEPGPLYAGQASALEGRGADLFVVETFFDLDDLVTAVSAIRAVSALPIVALLTFGSDGQTLAGVSAGDVPARLRDLDVAAFGANHGAGPAAALSALAKMQGSDRPLAALPNVGLASMSGQRIVFPHATPAYFGQFAAQARALGAAIIGGCCGTTPAQIAAIRAAVDENLTPSRSLLLREREEALPPDSQEEPTQLERLLASGEFVVSVQLDPPLRANPEALLATARELRTRLTRGEDFHGRTIDAPTSFYPGVAVNPTADDLELEVDRFHRKVAAGARFAMTQILFDLEPLEAFRKRVGGAWPVPLLVGVWPIRTYELLLRVHNETPGMVVPEHVQERYRAAGGAAREVGGELGLELLAGARELASGAYVVAPFRQPLNVLDFLPALQPAHEPVETGS